MRSKRDDTLWLRASIWQSARWQRNYYWVDCVSLAQYHTEVDENPYVPAATLVCACVRVDVFAALLCVPRSVVLSSLHWRCIYKCTYAARSRSTFYGHQNVRLGICDRMKTIRWRTQAQRNETNRVCEPLTLVLLFIFFFFLSFIFIHFSPFSIRLPAK